MQRIIAASWGKLHLLQKLRFYIEIEILFQLYVGGRMKRRSRGLLIVATIAYIGFFLTFADKIPPQILFTAGAFLGALLIGLWLFSLFSRK